MLGFHDHRIIFWTLMMTQEDSNLATCEAKKSYQYHEE